MLDKVLNMVRLVLVPVSELVLVLPDKIINMDRLVLAVDLELEQVDFILLDLDFKEDLTKDLALLVDLAVVWDLVLTSD